MTVLLLSACPPGVRGDVSKWLMEITPGVYIGKLTLRTREALWKRVCKQAGKGRAVMVCTARNEQGFVYFVHNTDWQPVDFDGVFLMRRPLPMKKTKAKRSEPDQKPAGDTVSFSDPTGNLFQLSARINTVLNAPFTLHTSDTAGSNPSTPIQDTAKEQELPSNQETNVGYQETSAMQEGTDVNPHASPLAKTSKDGGTVCATVTDPVLQNVTAACETADQQAKIVYAAISRGMNRRPHLRLPNRKPLGSVVHHSRFPIPYGRPRMLCL